jgi:hypothetical protein
VVIGPKGQNKPISAGPKIYHVAEWAPLGGSGFRSIMVSLRLRQSTVSLLSLSLQVGPSRQRKKKRSRKK